MTRLKTFSTDGGLTWSEPQAIFASSAIHLCEPGTVRSPDGKQLAVLLRENRRKKNSHIIFSDDEGKSWSEPRELPGALTGDRVRAREARRLRVRKTVRPHGDGPAKEEAQAVPAVAEKTTAKE
ncbi:MAG: exo-alpha-sialidase [Acidobacteria bacterium]|nr:exo-alpha-sialidase [Acidobacteriota bacterium]